MMPSLRKRIYIFLVISSLTLLLFLYLFGYLLFKTSVRSDTENMMIYHGLFIEESLTNKDADQLSGPGLTSTAQVTAYRDINQLPSYIRQGFQWKKMEQKVLYEAELKNSENRDVYVYALVYGLESGEGDLYIISEYLQDIEEQMHYEQSLFYENATLIMVAGSLLILVFLFLFFLLYHMLLSPIRAVSDWLSEPSQPIPYDKIKYLELTAVVDSYKESAEKQKDLIQREELFLSTMSHELRTPIAIISSSVELLERLGVEKKIAKVNSRISYAIRNMNYLAKTLLWLSRKNNQPLSKSTINLSNLIRSVITDNEYLIIGRDTELSIQCNIESEYEVHENYGAAYLVLVNLVRNALQYSADGEILIHLKEGEVTVQNPYEKGLKTSTTESYGYGLYLVEKICVARGFVFTIDYQKEDVIAKVSFDHGCQ